MDGADGVYPSSEDTFLLIDALQRERAYLAELLPAHPVCVEVGYVSHFPLRPVSFQVPLNKMS